MLVLLIGLALSGTPVALDVPANAPCRLSERLAPAVTNQHIEVQPNAAWRVEVRASDVLEVRMLDAKGLVLGERSLTVAPADCEVLPRTLALLIRSWTEVRLGEPTTRPSPEPPPLTSREVPAETPPTPKHEPPRAPREPPHGLAEEVVTANVRPERPSSRPSSLPEVTSTDSPDAALPKPEVDGGLPVAPADTEVVARLELDAGAASSGDGWSGSVWVAGGVSAAPDDQPVAHGAAWVDLRLVGRFGVALEGGAESSRSTTVGPGHLSASLQWLGGNVRAELLRHGDGRLVTSFGARAVRIAAWADGLSENRSTTLWNAALTGALEWRQRLLAGFALALRLTVQARIQPERLVISGAEGTLSIPAWGAALSLAAGWMWE